MKKNTTNKTETKNVKKSPKTSKTKSSTSSKTTKSSTTSTTKRKSSKKATKRKIKKILLFILFLVCCYFAYKYYVQEYGVPCDTVLESVESSSPVSTEASVGEQSSDTSNVVEKSVEKNNVSSENYSFSSDYVQNHPLFLGNPTDAIFDISSNENYLMEKKQYSLSYNNQTLNPNWVGWHLEKEDLGDAKRTDKFIPDDTLPDGWYKVRKEDYKFNAYGFDRGHVCPSADKTATTEDNQATFLMTNMIPQSPNCNRIVWMHLESYERELVEQGNELYIFAGPYGTGGSGSRGFFNEILITKKDGSEYKINVPSHSWKVMIILPESSDDISAITEDTMALAVCIPNTQECKYIEGTDEPADWENYICSINDIEKMTGYDFFELLEDSLEEKLESKVYSK